MPTKCQALCQRLGLQWTKHSSRPHGACSLIDFQGWFWVQFVKTLYSGLGLDGVRPSCADQPLPTCPNFSLRAAGIESAPEGWLAAALSVSKTSAIAALLMPSFSGCGLQTPEAPQRAWHCLVPHSMGVSTVQYDSVSLLSWEVLGIYFISTKSLSPH